MLHRSNAIVRANDLDAWVNEEDTAACSQNNIDDGSAKANRPTDDDNGVMKEAPLSTPSSDARRKPRRTSERRRTWASLGLGAATLWWVGALCALEGSVAGVAQILGLSATVMVACFAVHVAVIVAARRVSLRSPLVFAHYLQGILIFAAYVTSYALNPTLFLDTWRSLYFGFYLFDVAVLLIFWRQLFRAYRTFYATHHVVSFAITGTWMVVGGAWLDYIVLGVLLWLSSDIWSYGLAMVRCTPGSKRHRRRMGQLQVAAFFLERTHRMAAYALPCLLADVQLSTLALVILGTGLFNDALDASFQWRGVRAKLASCFGTADTPSGGDLQKRKVM